MKAFLHFFLMVLLTSASNIKLKAQLFESVPLGFGVIAYQIPEIMYYDSIDEVSYIAGSFKMINNTACNVVKYDGITYSLMSMSPLTENTNAIMRYKDKMYFGGQDGLVTWDGTNWATIDSNISINNLAVNDDKLYVMGVFDSIVGQPIGMIAVWNDTTWSDLYKIDTLLSLHYSNNVSTIAFYKGNVYIAGVFTHSLNPFLESLLMFDGQRWRSVDGFHIDGIGGINDLTVYQNELYVSGGFLESTGSAGNAIAKWDGVNWHRLGEGVMRSYPMIQDIINYKGELYMCGWFNDMDGINLGTPYRGFVKWDGTRWCSLGMHSDNVAVGLGNWKDELFIMGRFEVINGDSMQYMAKWIGGNNTDTCSTPTTNIKSLNPNLNLSVYPNPTSGQFNIRFYNSNKQSSCLIQITNILGQVVYSSNNITNRGLNHYNVDLNNTTTGVYFLKINGENINETVQLIKR